MSLSFDNAKLSDVVNVIVRTQLKRDYVIHPDAHLDQLVTFKLSNIKSEKLYDIFVDLTSAYGASVVDRGGVIYI